MPQSSDDYVHRVGRTGRMGREGVAYSFVTPEQGTELTRIEMLINKLLTRDEIEGFETTAPAAPPTERPQARFFGVRPEQPAAKRGGGDAKPAAPKPDAQKSEEPKSEEPKPEEAAKPKPPSRQKKRHRRAL